MVNLIPFYNEATLIYIYRKNPTPRGSLNTGCYSHYGYGGAPLVSQVLIYCRLEKYFQRHDLCLHFSQVCVFFSPSPLEGSQYSLD